MLLCYLFSSPAVPFDFPEVIPLVPKVDDHWMPLSSASLLIRERLDLPGAVLSKACSRKSSAAVWNLIGDEIHRWVSTKETDFEELKERVNKALEAAHILKLAPFC